MAFALALVIGTTVPGIRLRALRLVALTGPFELLVRGAYRRREAALGRRSEPDAMMDSSPEVPSLTSAEQPAGE